MSLPILAAAGGAPIVVVFALLVGMRWPAIRAMAVGWITASVLGLVVWRMEPGWWTAAAMYGVLQAVEIILIVFGALLLMNHLERSGAVATIRRHFAQITTDRRVQVLLIGLGFMTLVEGAAGFGTPGALAAPLMLGLGFPRLAAAVFGLMFNAPQPPFGAAGTPVIGGIGAVIDAGVLAEAVSVSRFLEDVTAWTAVVTGTALSLWGLVGVFLLLFWFGRTEDRSLRGALRRTMPVVPLALLLGVLGGATQMAVAWVFGPELPNIAAGFVVLGIGVMLARAGILMPAERWDFADRAAWPGAWRAGLENADRHQSASAEEDPAGSARHADARDEVRMPVLLAWAPYLIVALVLVVTRWPDLVIGEWLRGRAVRIEYIFGQDLSFTLRYLYLPGVVPFIPVALLTALLHRMRRSQVLAAWRDTGRQIVAPAMTLIVAVSMTQVMIQSATNTLGVPGMMQALSEAVALAAGGWLPAVAPWIGALGAFMTGSNTSSNVLFSVLQHDAAADLGVSRTIAVALQNVGGGIGNMLAVLNIAAICGVLRMSGMEGTILRRTLVPTVVYATLAGMAGMLLVWWFPETY